MQFNKLKMVVLLFVNLILLACGGGGSEKANPAPVPSPQPLPNPNPPSSPKGTSVIVDPLTQKYIGRVSTLDRSKFFNLHDNMGNSGNYTVANLEFVQDSLQAGHGRQFYSPMGAVRAQINSGVYPSTEYAMNNGPNSVNNFYANPLRDRYSKRLVITEHPRNVMTDTNDPIEGARWAADYFTHYYDDVSRPIFYEPMNEPFVHANDFAANYNGSQEQVRHAMTTWFKEIGREFDTRPELADVNIIGFASAWPSFERFNFGNWQDRMKMFIDNAGAQIDSLSVHLYDGINVQGAETFRSGSNSQAILDLIETYSMIKLDKVLPHSITEYGAIVDRPNGIVEYDAAINSQTVKSFNHIMLELMNREDRLLTSIPFITGHATWYWQDPNQGNGHPYNPSMWRPNRNNIELVNNRWRFIDSNADDNYLLNANSVFFDFWKQVKGHRVAITNSDPDLQTAAFVDEDTAYIVLSNLESEEKTVQLNLAAMDGYQYTSIQLDRLKVPADSAATLSTEIITETKSVTTDDIDAGNITLDFGESIKFTIKFNQTVGIKTKLQRISYYSDEHLKTISAKTALNFVFSEVDITTIEADKSYAMLRMSIAREHARSKQPQISVNGIEVSVPDDWPGYNQNNREQFFGSIEIPVPFDLLTATNAIEIVFDDNGGHVSSVILDVTTGIN